MHDVVRQAIMDKLYVTDFKGNGYEFQGRESEDAVYSDIYRNVAREVHAKVDKHDTWKTALSALSHYIELAVSKIYHRKLTISLRAESTLVLDRDDAEDRKF